MNDVMNTLSQLQNITRMLMSEVNQNLKDNNIAINTDDLLLLYEIQQSQETLSPEKIASKSKRIIQHVIFQLKSLENRNLITLDSNSIDVAEQNIKLNNNVKLQRLFKDINTKILNKVRKNVENHLSHLSHE